jgi:hypothetical protein
MQGIKKEDGVMKPYLEHFSEFLTGLDSSARESAREKQVEANRSLMF